MRRLVLAVYALLFVDELLLLGIVPLAPTFKDEFSLTDTETGLLLASASIATVLLAVPTGLLADRIGARRLTIAAGFVIAIGALGQGLADVFWLLLVARIVFGCGSAVLWTAGTAWLADSVSAGRRAAALGTVMVVAGVGSTIGPAYAGFLTENVSIRAPFLITAVLAVVVTLVVLASGPGRQLEHARLPLAVTLKAARAEQLVLAGLVITVLAGLSDGVVGLLAPLQLDENGLSAGAIGVAFSAAAATFLVGSTVVVRLGDRAVSRRAAWIGSILLALSMAPFLASLTTAAIVSGVLLRAAFVALLYTISFPLAVRGAHRIGLGRGAAIGLLNLGWGTATLIGPLAAGALAETVGGRAGYAALAALGVGAAVFLAARSRTPSLARAPQEAPGA
jgi:MFS family permease